MASYLVLEPADATRDKAEKAVLLRDGFAVLAFVVPLFWFLWHRMWLEALVFLGIGSLLGALGTLPGYGVLAPLLSILLSLLIGLEAQALRAASLRRRGWNEWGVVEGTNLEEAELRYAAEAEPAATQRPPAAPPTVPSAPRAAPAGGKADSATFGLVDYPRRS